MSGWLRLRYFDVNLVLVHPLNHTLLVKTYLAFSYLVMLTFSTVKTDTATCNSSLFSDDLTGFFV